MNFESYVDRLFEQAPDRREDIRTNPITGGRWVNGVDPIAPQKREACRRLVARARFARLNPDLPPLPLSYGEREELKDGSLTHLLAWYGRSLEYNDYDVARHPSFEAYACGVMASPHAPPFIKENDELRKRHAPRALPGLGSGLYWDDPTKLPS